MHMLIRHATMEDLDAIEAVEAAVLSNEAFWGQDLSTLAGVEDAVASYTEEIRTLGMRKAMEKIFA